MIKTAGRLFRPMLCNQLHAHNEFRLLSTWIISISSNVLTMFNGVEVFLFMQLDKKCCKIKIY